MRLRVWAGARPPAKSQAKEQHAAHQSFGSSLPEPLPTTKFELHPQRTMGAWMMIHQKRQLIEKPSECPAMAQHELAAWAKRTFKLKRAPTQSTISDILRAAPAIMSEAYGDGKRRKPLEVTTLALEQKLWAWIQFVEALDVCISRKLIRMKAQDLQTELCDAWT
ncbi:unnamed protein product [Phytophthora lilii]|uniref:Unnamed protein product n=1 Tax=Phytophthora lilii TaxID=2077276 RepID=A0A9W6U596_9STRA|nr:unnamed protein product [Phytophthora lilii]